MRVSKIYGFWLMAVVIMLVSVMSVMASVANITWSNPVSSDTISGTIVLNATSNVTASTNLTFQARCTDTVNSSYATLNITSNTTRTGAAGAIYLSSFDTTSLEDSSICELKAFIGGNDTGDLTSTISGIRVDNTVPVAPTLMVGTVKTDTVTFNATVTEARTVYCRLVFTGSQRLDAQDNVSSSSGQCSFSYSRPAEGSYAFQVYAYDGLNSTASPEGLLQVDREGRSSHNVASAVVAAQAAKMTQKDKTLILVIGGIVLVYWFFGRK